MSSKCQLGTCVYANLGSSWCQRLYLQRPIGVQELWACPYGARLCIRSGDMLPAFLYAAHMVSCLEVKRDPARWRLRRRLQVIRAGAFVPKDGIMPGHCIEVLCGGARAPWDWVLVPAIWQPAIDGLAPVLPVESAFAGEGGQGMPGIRCLIPVTGFRLAGPDGRGGRRLRLEGRGCFLVAAVAARGKVGGGVLSVSPLAAPAYVDQVEERSAPLVVTLKSAGYWFERPDNRLLFTPAGVRFIERR